MVRKDAIERESIRRKIRREIATAIRNGQTERVQALEDLLTWVLSRPTRYQAKKGGL